MCCKGFFGKRSLGFGSAGLFIRGGFLVIHAAAQEPAAGKDSRLELMALIM